MSGRISSQGSIIRVSDEDIDTVQVAVTGATKAKPCVLTCTTGVGMPVVGDIVVPRGTGWNSLDGMPFKVSVVASGAVTLEDSDTTREPSAVAGGAQISKPDWLDFCRANFTANQPAGTTIDVTTLCDVAHRIVPGLPAIATWTSAGFDDCDDVALDRVRLAYRTGELIMLDVVKPDGCGFTFAAIVNTYDVTLGVNAAIANTVGGQIDGLVHVYKTPPPGFTPLVVPQRAGGGIAAPPRPATMPAPPPEQNEQAPA
jgi:hypothetical protein